MMTQEIEIIFPEMTSAESAPDSGVGGSDFYDFDTTGWLAGTGETLASHTIFSDIPGTLAVSLPTAENDANGVALLAQFKLVVALVDAVSAKGIKVWSKCVSSAGKTKTFIGRVPIVVKSGQKG